MKLILKSLNTFVLWGYKILRNLGAAALAVLFLTISLGIFTRYVLNAPITWGEELATFMMVHICFISAATTTVQKKHIVADFFIARAPEKFHKIMNIVGQVLQLIFFAVLFYSIIVLLPTLVWKSPVLLIPRQYYYASALVCSVFMFITVVTSILNEIFPGYDLIKQENEKREAALKEQERQEAMAMQEDMDKFMAEAGYGKSDAPAAADERRSADD